jgi:hypothetical protein
MFGRFQEGLIGSLFYLSHSPKHGASSREVFVASCSFVLAIGLANNGKGKVILSTHNFTRKGPFAPYHKTLSCSTLLPIGARFAQRQQMTPIEQKIWSSKRGGRNLRISHLRIIPIESLLLSNRRSLTALTQLGSLSSAFYSP